jgi:hypothetical protein
MSAAAGGGGGGGREAVTRLRLGDNWNSMTQHTILTKSPVEIHTHEVVTHTLCTGDSTPHTFACCAASAAWISMTGWLQNTHGM